MVKTAQRTTRRAKSIISLGSIDAKLDRVIDVISELPTRTEFQEFRREANETRDIVRSLVTSMDALTKAVGDVLLEYHLIKQQLGRHDRWFQELAKKTGVELKP